METEIPIKGQPKTKYKHASKIISEEDITLRMYNCVGLQV